MGEILTIMSLPVVIAIGVCLEKGHLKALAIIFSVWMVCIFGGVYYVISHTPKISDEERTCKLLQFILKDEFGIFADPDIVEAKRDIVLQQLKEIQNNGYDCGKYL